MHKQFEPESAYTWTYKADASAQSPVFASMLKICAAIGLGMALICAIIGIGWLGPILLTGMVGLPALAWVLLGRLSGGTRRERYALTEETLWVSTAWKQHTYSLRNVRRMRLCPGKDLIELHMAELAVVHVFADRERYGTVLDFIRARLPEGAKVDAA